MLIYLAGPIDSGPAWPETKNNLLERLRTCSVEGVVVFDPAAAYNFNGLIGDHLWRAQLNAEAIIKANEAVITAADLVIAVNPHLSLGTGREVQFAYSIKKQVDLLIFSPLVDGGALPNSALTTPYTYDYRGRSSQHTSINGEFGYIDYFERQYANA